MATIKCKSIKTGREVSFERDLGDNVQDAIAKFGEAAVFELYMDQAVIRCQAIARNALDKVISETDPTPVHTEEEAVEAGKQYTPGVRAPRGEVSAAASMGNVMAKIAKGDLSAEQVAAFLKQLKAKQQELEAAAKAAAKA